MCINRNEIILIIILILIIMSNVMQYLIYIWYNDVLFYSACKCNDSMMLTLLLTLQWLLMMMIFSDMIPDHMIFCNAIYDDYWYDDEI